MYMLMYMYIIRCDKMWYVYDKMFPSFFPQCGKQNEYEEHLNPVLMSTERHKTIISKHKKRIQIHINIYRVTLSYCTGDKGNIHVYSDKKAQVNNRLK